ncbi:3-deoxy-D-manno-octulosonic acid transferase [Rhodoferax saidenbachensis]|uniref:3-deoxy-D-manno-octulosonic acid transferase n=1 Tax=Rhodoferax saidenbachensis TaxID=1484693 RepID=A0A1P8K7U5_9BURK|nr:3-deoxy-D-manno-octulosonic acid transferase [Rhodoferax saidenbachensis]APW42041.1 3-deoxy-D-manno-octulosonic acid transferase [Rhodoferax saidenbachensis]
MIRFLYACALTLMQPLVRRKLARRALDEPVYGEAVEERFGHYTAPAETTSNLIWVHAVSLGETRAAAVLVAQLRAQLPGMRLLLTHGTATGRVQGRSLLRDGDLQVWQPWDTSAAVARFLAHFRPRIGLLMETEVWPNLVAGCATAGVPLCLVNARLSDKSLRQAEQLGWLSRPAYRGLRAVWAQSEADAQRLRSLGAPVMGVMGNFKFDATPDATQLAQGKAMRLQSAKPVLVFASSREGEEAMLLEKFKQKVPLATVDIAQAAPETIANTVHWLIVPRHPQRFAEVAKLFEDAGLRVSRRSNWVDGVPAEADIWLGDTLGEMALYFGLADAALLGGSFAPLGGQNLIEAAACGCPVVMGPHTFNFAEAAQLAQAAGAAFVATDLAQAVDQAIALVQSPQALQQAEDAALALGLAHRGAAQRTAEAVIALLLG